MHFQLSDGPHLSRHTDIEGAAFDEEVASPMYVRKHNEWLLNWHRHSSTEPCCLKKQAARCGSQKR